MTLRLLAVLFALASALPAAAFEMPSRAASAATPTLPAAFRAPAVPLAQAVHLAALQAKSAPTVARDDGRWKVGDVRALAKAAPVSRWTKVDGGYVARLRATSDGALGLRVRLDLGTLPGPLEARVQGVGGPVETQVIDSTRGLEAWTPWTEGATQTVELFSPVQPMSEDAVRVGAVVHFTASPLAKAAAGTCTLETMCAPTDPSLTAPQAQAILERADSVARLLFVNGGSSFVCSGTLVNTEKYPAGYILTANHCIDDAASANSVSLLWFDESNLNCLSSGYPRMPVQTNGGTQLVFTNYNVDSTLLLTNQPPPEGALYAGLDTDPLPSGSPVVSISHPKGDTTRYAVGTISRMFRVSGWPQEMYGVRFSSGIIEGGSSGSGLFTLSGEGLVLRGILTGTTLNQPGGMSCTNLNEQALYSRFEIFGPEIEPYIRASYHPVDDAPNRPQDISATAPPLILDNPSGVPFALDRRAIDYVGDVDVYRFLLSAPAWVSAWTQGANIDTLGNILDSTGVNVAYNDDAQASDNHFGLTQKLQPGTYYLQVAHWEPQGTGPYDLRLRADVLDTNYTDLWWNASESGWGLNINHQGNTIFATLFTYDTNGAGMWLVMANGERQPDGSYAGTLYRTQGGGAFNAVPFPPATPTAVGTMRLTFLTSSTATLTYTYNGTSVTKSITRQVFDHPPTCTWSAFDRSYATNYQDLWWNPNEPGWGVNLTHQGATAFATLFTYDTNGAGLWLVMPNGANTGQGFSGSLYRTTGPAFNTVPWTPIASTVVGTMTFSFTDGNHGTLTYSVNGVTVSKLIQRQTFAALRPLCGS